MTLEKLIDEYLEGAEKVGRDLRSWDISVQEARRLERAAYQSFMDEVEEYGFDKREAKELWEDVVISVGINDPEFEEKYL